MKTIDEILDEWYPTIPDEEHNGLYARDKVKLIAQEFADQFRQPAVNGCFYLQSEKKPDHSGEYEVITNRGRVIKIKYKLFEDSGIWECEYGQHKINESVVAWRFLK